VTDPTLADYNIQHPLPPTPHWQQLDARRVADGVPERLTVFSSELSCNPEFRRALKTDRTMLLMLQHQSVLRVLGTGESDGTLFLRNEACDSPSLLQQIRNGRRFSAEDIIEIGWQVCSALQRAHNLGLSHGRITADTVLCSETLQVTLADFGFSRWLEAAERHNSGSSTVAASGPGMLRQQFERDLADLAMLLQQLLQDAGDPAVSDAATSVGLQRLLGRCLESSPDHRPLTAREFQGRLGELLIDPGTANMPVFVDRDSPGKAKRSIVEDLFGPATGTAMKPAPAGPSAGSASRMQILPLLVAVAVLVILTLLAVLLR
jgi:hypothetical protein